MKNSSTPTSTPPNHLKSEGGQVAFDPCFTARDGVEFFIESRRGGLHRKNGCHNDGQYGKEAQVEDRNTGISGVQYLFTHRESYDRPGTGERSHLRP
jgi:hypothetical protein